MVILGIGNVLQKDDGFGVYASTYLLNNYTFSPEIKVLNGGVEGIKLFSVFEENKNILILDAIKLEDEPGSIYLIPSHELSGKGLNSGGAHEIGVIQCLDMLELQDKPLPKATLLGIIPDHVTFEMALSKTMTEVFERYIKVALRFLEKEGIKARKKECIITLEEIIQDCRKI